MSLTGLELKVPLFDRIKQRGHYSRPKKFSSYLYVSGTNKIELLFLNLMQLVLK